MEVIESARIRFRAILPCFLSHSEGLYCGSKYELHVIKCVDQMRGFCEMETGLLCWEIRVSNVKKKQSSLKGDLDVDTDVWSLRYRHQQG